MSGSSGDVYSRNQAIHRFWLNDEDVSSVLENRRTLQAKRHSLQHGAVLGRLMSVSTKHGMNWQ